MRNVTAFILVSVAVLLALYDVFAYAQAGGDATISWVIYTSARQYPIIPFFLGVVVGHILAPMYHVKPLDQT